MQIHELDPFIGTLSDNTMLAVDDGVETMKMPATGLGITDEMTVQEIVAGTSTEPRVITPAVASNFKVLVLEAIISSLPATLSDVRITTDLVCIKAELGNPSAQVSDWNVDTDTAGEATITGSINGSTTVKLYMAGMR